MTAGTRPHDILDRDPPRTVPPSRLLALAGAGLRRLAVRLGAVAPPREARPYLGRGMTSEVFARGPGTVVKLFYAHVAPETIRQEVTATQWAHARGLPVAQPHGLVTQGDRTGIVLARLDGPTLINRYARNPVGLVLGLRRLAHLQARINAQDAADGLPPLHDLMRFQLGHARVSEAARAAAHAALDRLPRGSGLCHGDLHPSNVICAGRDLVVIDWQKATAGNPAADVARTLVLIRYGRLKCPPGLRRRVIQASRRLAAWWYVRCYAEASGIPVAAIEAWQLPLLAAKLTGPVAGNEAEVYALVEGLAARAA